MADKQRVNANGEANLDAVKPRSDTPLSRRQPTRAVRALHAPHPDPEHRCHSAMSPRVACAVRAKPLINAHIFPWALATDVGTPKNPGREYAPNGAHPRRLPTGWYDPEILCERCDGRVLGPLDAYGVEFLRAVDQYHVHLTAPNGARLGSRFGADPVRLKSFLLSLLRRAAVSRLPEFAGVSLGPFETALRRRILDSSIDAVDDFATMVTWCDDDPGELISPPQRIRFRGGVCAYILHVGRHSAVIKVDSRRAPEFIRPLLLDSGRTVTVLIDSVIEGPIGRQVRRLIEVEDRAAWSTGSPAPRRRR